MSENYCYIIDKYNKFQNNNNVISIFSLFINGQYESWCIRKIPIKKYNWGTPEPENWAEQNFEEDYSYQRAYSTKEEALEFIRSLKEKNR